LILVKTDLLKRGRGQNRKKLHAFAQSAVILVQNLAEKSGSDLGPIRGVLLNLWCNSGYLCRHIFNQLRALSPLSRQRSRVRVSSSPPAFSITYRNPGLDATVQNCPIRPQRFPLS